MSTSKEDSSTANAIAADSIIIKVNARWISYIHTILGYVAFFSTLIIACLTHYHQIVKNEHWGYPEEWFPSVSAVTGDWYPARSVFQIMIAVTSGPRFALIFLFYMISNKPDHLYPKIHAIVGLIRTISCGGWTYITSTEDHDIHDVSMITYVVLTLPWMLGCLAIAPPNNKQAQSYRRRLVLLFFGTLVPMTYFFVRHKVYAVPGAYTIYAFFEWSLIAYDIAFDAVSLYDFNSLEIRVIDVTRQQSGNNSFFNGTTSTISSDTEKAKTNTATTTTTNNNITLYNLEKFMYSGFWYNLRGFIADTYLAFVYWTMLTSLALTIWYFPLWHMGISGFEVCLLVTISPVLLGIPSVRYLIATNRSIFHLISLSGLAAYFFTDPTARLFVVSFGVAMANLMRTSRWIENRDNTGKLEHDALVWTLGLILSNVVKMAWWTNNPIWPIMHKENGGCNFIGLLLGVIAAFENIIYQNKSFDNDNKSSVKINTEGKPHQQQHRLESWFFTAGGFGSLLFALHSLLSDSSTITRWVIQGYPDTGPLPIPWGAATIVAMSLGLVLSTNRKIVTSFPWYVIGCVSCSCMYYYPAWNGYYGGLILAVYLVSLVPIFIHSVTRYPPGRTFFTAMMIYNILCLAHVWTVAYAFVPAGEYLREHTDYVLFAMMLLIGAGVLDASSADFSYKQLQINQIRSVRSLTKIGLAALIVISFVIVFIRLPSQPPQPYHPDQKLLTAGIWTVHFGLDNDMWASEYRMRDVIKELELDVIGLLESDLERIIMGNRDLTQFLAEDLNMYADYGPGPSKHTWGCSMLSKFPIISSTHHLLPSPVGELACAIHATLDVYGQPVDVIVSHNGQEEDPEDRRLQTTELARIMNESKNPFIFLGYVVTKPLNGNYFILTLDGRMNDIDPLDDDRWCEYIVYRGMKRTGYARISHGGLTDTEIQAGKFQALTDKKYNPDTWKASYRRIEEEEIAPGLRFPAKFKGDGVRGHHYHVFNEPRYYD
ncbi:841_t:CDS:10 [Ambispora gerdemannii]|uniref:841_t:CDS:1 n=1 Tax=Ambispora gerdemannii TaxID=144530 RepID=A0A9N9BC80_9GLOM|nr:841_t:CDS:10 [Ambispora gerdemannii]